MQQDNSAKIGAATATIISMNAMIGAGIFTTPAQLALSVGPAGILTYIFVIIAVWLMALSIARVVQMYPQEGSFYTYAKQWGGHTAGVLAAGAYVVGVLIALGLITQISSSYLHEFFPQLSSTLLGAFLIGAVVAFNVRGVRIMQVGQIALICCTMFALIATTIICFTHAHVEYLTPFMPHGFGSVVSATRTAVFAFFN